MKMHNKKRGFTIVELVIVIAVIAILSAVLIPTFAGIVKKSRQSADETAVRNMNTILAADGAVEPTTLEDLYSVLAENGIDAEDYKPMQNDTFFFWDSEANVIVYTDANYNVTYPADQVENVNHAAWISLSGEIREAKLSDVTLEDDGATAKVDNAEELYALVNAINDEKRAVKDVTTIKLAEGTFNFKGANVTIKGSEDRNDEIWDEFTIESAGTATTLQGIANLGAVRTGYSTAGAARENFGGLIGWALKADVTFRNINLKDCTFGSATTNMVGAFVGQVESGKLNIVNCDMENVTVNGLMKVGAYAGQLIGGATLSISADSVAENVTVNATVGFAGRLIGLAIGGTAPVEPVTVSGGEARFDDAITVNLVKDSAVKYITIDGKEYATDMEVENGKISIAQPEEYAATVSKYGFVAASGDSTADYNGASVNIKYHDVAELTF